MSAEVTIALGVAGRILANVALAHNQRLGAALVGVFDGFLIHRSYIANTLSDPFTLLIIGASIVFDYKQYPGLEEIITLLLGCGLGVVLADVGPDLLEDLGGGHLLKDVKRDFDYFLGNGDDSGSEAGSDGGSAVSRASSRSRRTSRSGTTIATGTSLTARPGPSTVRPRASLGRAPSTSTRLSRVTFDEASISQSAASTTEDLDADGDAASSSAAPSSATERPRGSPTEDLYMEPSTISAASALGAAAAAALGAGSSHTRVLSRPPSILRRLDIPGTPVPPVLVAGPSGTPPRPASIISSSSITSGPSRLTSDGEATPTPMPQPGPLDCYPTPESELEPEPEPMSADSAVPFLPPPPNTSAAYGYAPQFPQPGMYDTNYGYAPSPYGAEAMPVPLAYPEPTHTADSEAHTHAQGQPHEQSRFSRLMNVPMSDPHTFEPEPASATLDSPQSARLWIPPPVNGNAARSRSRSRSPVGPRSPPPHHDAQMPPLPPAEPAHEPFEDVGPAPYISESYEDATVDVRQLDRESAIAQIEEAWSIVEKRRHRRLNILVRHDDDELQSGPNSTFRLLEDLENMRFNAKVRPGLIIITSRSRA